MLPLLNQTILLWQVLLGSVFLGQRYSPVQLFGILLVVAGVAKAAWPSGAGGSILGQVTPFAFRFSWYDMCCCWSLWPHQPETLFEIDSHWLGGLGGIVWDDTPLTLQRIWFPFIGVI